MVKARSTAETLASAGSVDALAADDTYLWWSERENTTRGPAGLVRMAFAGGVPEAVLPMRTSSMALFDGFVVFLSRGGLWQLPFAGGEAACLASDQLRPRFLVKAGDEAFWLNYGSPENQHRDGALCKARIPGGEAVVLASGLEEVSGLAAYGSHLYFTVGAPRAKLMRATLDGRELVSLGATDPAWDLTVTEQDAYYAYSESLHHLALGAPDDGAAATLPNTRISRETARGLVVHERALLWIAGGKTVMSLDLDARETEPEVLVRLAGLAAFACHGEHLYWVANGTAGAKVRRQPLVRRMRPGPSRRGAPVEELLAQILAAPDDDTPRLVYADELQDQGNPLGELISVQCALAQRGIGTPWPPAEWLGDGLLDPAVVDADETKRLRKRETVLLKAHTDTWVHPLTRLLGNPSPTRFRFARGFLDHAPWAIATADVARLPELFALAPLVRSMAIEGAMPSADAMRAFLEHACVAGLRSFSYVDWLDEPLARKLADAPFFSKLERLAFRGTSLHGDWGRALLSGRLLELHLQACFPINATFVARAENLSRLGILSLVDNGTDDDGARALAESPNLRNLRALNLRRSQVRAEGVRALADDAALPELRVLDLADNAFGLEGVRMLTQGGGLGKLTELSLAKTDVGDDAAHLLAQSPLLAHLRVLNLRSNAITNAGAVALARSEHVKNLVSLQLTDNPIREEGKAALAELAKLGRVRVLTSR